MTKTEALAAFDLACDLGCDWEQAARALAAQLRPDKAPAPKAAKPNKRHGKPSLACSGVRLPIYQKQACGHWFNSSGCAVCTQCERRPARWVAEGPSFSTARDTQERVTLMCAAGQA